jgi:hypothetical protein
MADRHASDMGFVTRAAFLEAVERGELLVVPERAFARYRKRKRDDFTTLYNLVYEDAAAASALMRMLPRPLGCKVPVGSALDAYMMSLGALGMGTFKGKKRELQAWLLVEGMAR